MHWEHPREVLVRAKTISALILSITLPCNVWRKPGFWQYEITEWLISSSTHFVLCGDVRLSLLTHMTSGSKNRLSVWVFLGWDCSADVSRSWQDGPLSSSLSWTLQISTVLRLISDPKDQSTSTDGCLPEPFGGTITPRKTPVMTSLLKLVRNLLLHSGIDVTQVALARTDAPIFRQSAFDSSISQFPETLSAANFWEGLVPGSGLMIEYTR